MKHSKEWHTCDRCGKKMEIKPKNKIHWQCVGKYSDIVPQFKEDEIIGEIKTRYLLFPTEYELCSKCRKDFERFMRNE